MQMRARNQYSMVCPSPATLDSLYRRRVETKVRSAPLSTVRDELKGETSSAAHAHLDPVLARELAAGNLAPLANRLAARSVLWVVGERFFEDALVHTRSVELVDGRNIGDGRDSFTNGVCGCNYISLM